MKRKLDPKDARARLALTCECRLVEAAGEGGEKIPRFSMTAYTGGPMTVGYWDAPVVIDLAGLAIPSRHIPIRLQHDPEAGVGHTDRLEVAAGELVAEGAISRATDAARDVVESARRGFPWQASVGAAIKKYEFVKGGQSAVVNGRSVAGPVYIMREATLGEISFVDLGADSATSVQVAAQAAQTLNTGDPDMTPFEKWLQAMGLVLAELGDEQKAKLQAKFEAETAPPPAPVPPVPDPVADTRKAIAGELARCAAIRKVCGGNVEIEAKAVAENWTPERAELEVLRASRVAAPAVVVHGSEPVGTQLLQAAVDQALRLPDAEKRHPAPVVEAAHKRFRGRMGLQELVLLAARANGYAGEAHRVNEEVWRFATRPQVCGGFSTVDITGILSGTANKFLLAGFTAVDQTWRKIAAVRAVSDFKTVTSYRLTGDDEFALVSPAGEIESGTLGEESFTNKADTYGKILAITRQDIINDDLGAISTIPRKLGRGAGLKFNRVFWTAFMNNASFFTGQSYLDGATTTLTAVGLALALKKFRAITDADGNPVGVEPRVLLVPSDLEVAALQLTQSMTFNAGGSATTEQIPNQNVFAGKYQVAATSYLSNSAYTGYSALAWYLLADPQDVAAVEACFLNGVQASTIETADTEFDTLGMQMRAYLDFGVTKQDARAGVKVKGAA